jgi:hypothetical protein
MIPYGSRVIGHEQACIYVEMWDGWMDGWDTLVMKKKQNTCVMWIVEMGGAVMDFYE